jgi:putative ABC transport system permease protein
MGMDRGNVLVIENVHRPGTNAEAFRNALTQQTAVSKVSFTANKFPGTYESFLMRSTGSEGDHSVAGYYADFDSQDVLKFEIKDGRYFSRDFLSDSNAVVINEATSREFGFDRSEGQEILHSPNAYVFLRFHVIGIMKDFSFESYPRQSAAVSCIFRSRPFGHLVGSLRHE